MQVAKDLFGNDIIQLDSLKRVYGANPFTIIDTKEGMWNARKRKWLNLGIQSEVGRDVVTYSFKDRADKYGRKIKSDTSIFDPVLCEIMYNWFCKPNGTILDPFAGGSVRGIIANYLGFKYTGIDIREEQIKSNIEQAVKILDENNQPNWIVGDSNKVLDTITDEFDCVFTCPPYADLEVYSDLEGDISNMEYDKFIVAFEEIMGKACKLLKKDGYAVVIVGEVRDKDGNYYGFVPDTVKMFQRYEGMKYYNEAILATSLNTAPIRANNCMKTGKLVKVHQNILVFKKC